MIMTSDNKIENFQLFSITFFLVQVAIIGLCTRILMETGENFAWIATLIGGFLGLLPLLLYIYINKKKRELSLTELNIKIFGKIIGNIINFIILSFILYFFIKSLGVLGGFNVSQFSVKTPILAITLLITLIVIQANHYSLETIARAIQIIFFITIVMYLIIIFGLLPQLEVSNTLPLFEVGTSGIIRSIILFGVYTSSFMFFILAIPITNVSYPNKVGKTMVIGYLTAILFNVLDVLLPTLVFGFNLLIIFECPVYSVIKKVKIFGFLDRLENVLVSVKFFSIIILLIMLMYYFNQSIKQIFKIKNRMVMKIITIVVPIILAIFAKDAFANQIVADHWFLDTAPYMLGGICIGIPIIIFIRLLFYKRIKSLH